MRFLLSRSQGFRVKTASCIFCLVFLWLVLTVLNWPSGNFRYIHGLDHTQDTFLWLWHVFTWDINGAFPGIGSGFVFKRSPDQFSLEAVGLLHYLHVISNSNIMSELNQWYYLHIEFNFHKKCYIHKETQIRTFTNTHLVKLQS